MRSTNIQISYNLGHIALESWTLVHHFSMQRSNGVRKHLFKWRLRKFTVHISHWIVLHSKRLSWHITNKCYMNHKITLTKMRRNINVEWCHTHCILYARDMYKIAWLLSWREIHGDYKCWCYRYQKIISHILWTTVYLFNVRMTNGSFLQDTNLHATHCVTNINSNTHLVSVWMRHLQKKVQILIFNCMTNN